MAGVPPPLILAYHGVGDVPAHRDPEGLFITPRQLRAQIARLRRWGYSFVTFGAMADLAAAGRHAGHVALTFDDGLADNLELLAPLARDEGVPVTVFVTTGWMGAPHPSVPYARIMTGDEVRALHAEGVEIGAHTVTHPDLTVLTPAAARQEIADSCAQLAELTGSPVDLLAYPFGFVSAGALEAAAAANVRAACGVAGRGAWSQPLHLPRQDTNTKSALGFWLKRDGRYEPIMRHAPARALRRLGKERRRAVSRWRER